MEALEDTSSSDDEIEVPYSPSSPQFGGKKLKLNDGSSQDSFRAAGKSPPSHQLQKNVT